MRAHLHAADVRVGEVGEVGEVGGHDVLGAGQIGGVDDIAGDRGEVGGGAAPGQHVRCRIPGMAET
ncbi:hypothetical protein [Streptomyces sp. NPDC051561]|uniref:hypothetical protein n=1 Tax=Streptomyces sp. NPDC051561 TaxID=3365658 RepID=UPI003794D92C